MQKSVIVSAARTPFGKFGGALKDFSAPQLGGLVLQEVVQRAGVEDGLIDHVIMGQVLQGGAGQIPSRQATRAANLPWQTTSETINKVCGSGLRAVAMADQMIRAGDVSTVLAGGMESMSRAPYFVQGARFGLRMFDGALQDLMVHDGLWCPFYDRHMAVHGGVIAKEYGVSRAEQDEWALRSQLLASEAMAAGRLADEIVPVVLKSKQGERVFDQDESVRADCTLQALEKLPPVFAEDNTVTAGNAPSVNDGAAALMVMSQTQAQDLGLPILAYIEGHAMASEDAAYIATVPALATLKLLQKQGLSVQDVDLFEINEAFAAVALVSGRIAKWDVNKVNVDGGAIAFGHPIGASGARILMHLIYALRRRGGGLGVAAICSGGAQGDAMLIRVD